MSKALYRKKRFIIPVSLMLLMGIFFAYISSGAFIKRHVLPIIEEQTKFDIKAKEIDFSLLSGKLSFTEFTAVSGPSSIYSNELSIDVDLIECINKNIVIENLNLNDGNIILAFDAAGKLKTDPGKARELKVQKAKKAVKPTKAIKKTGQKPWQLPKLPQFLVEQLKINQLNIELNQLDRYGNPHKQDFRIEELAISNLGQDKDFKVQSSNSFTLREASEVKLASKQFELKLNGNFKQDLSQANIQSEITLKSLSSEQFKQLDTLSIKLNQELELSGQKIDINSLNISCLDGDKVLSKISCSGNFNSSQELNMDLKLNEVSSHLLNFALSLAPPSKSIKAWQERNMKAGYVKGFADTSLNGHAKVTSHNNEFDINGQVKISDLPLSQNRDGKLQKYPLGSDLNFQAKLSNNKLHSAKLDARFLDKEQNKIASFKVDHGESLKIDIQSNQFDLNLINNFDRKAPELSGSLNSNIKFELINEKQISNIDVDIKNFSIAESEINSADFRIEAQSNGDLKKSIIEKLRITAKEKSLGSVYLSMPKGEFVSKNNFEENQLTTDLIEIHPKLNMDQFNLPPQTPILSFNKFSLVQSKESIQVISRVLIDQFKYKNFNALKLQNDLDLNIQSLQKSMGIILKNLSLSNHGKEVLSSQLISIENSNELAGLQKITFLIPNIELHDLQQINVITENQTPQFQPQKISLELKGRVSQYDNGKAELAISSPKLKIMDQTQLSLGANITKVKHRVALQNISIGEGEHILNLNASIEPNSYELEDFNGSLDLAYINSVLKSLNPNFPHSFHGIINFNETSIKTSGSTPEELFANLAKSKIDWDFSNLLISLEKKEKTFISKDLGFKPEKLAFDKGKLLIEGSPSLIELKEFKLTGPQGAFDLNAKVYADGKALKSEQNLWSAFQGSPYLRIYDPQKILDKVNELDEYLDFNKDKDWFELDRPLNVKSTAESGKFADLANEIQTNTTKTLDIILNKFHLVKNIQEGKFFEKETIGGVLDIFREREEEKAKEREKKGKKPKKSKTKEVLDILDGLF